MRSVSLEPAASPPPPSRLPTRGEDRVSEFSAGREPGKHPVALSSHTSDGTTAFHASDCMSLRASAEYSARIRKADTISLLFGCGGRLCMPMATGCWAGCAR